MSSYGSYPNPQLCAKHGQSVELCGSCAFNDSCIVLKEANEKSITSKDCKFVLLVELPTGKMHQVIIEDSILRSLITAIGDFKVIEKPIDSIELKNNT